MGANGQLSGLCLSFDIFSVLAQTWRRPVIYKNVGVAFSSVHQISARLRLYSEIIGALHHILASRVTERAILTQISIYSISGGGGGAGLRTIFNARNTVANFPPEE